MRSPDVDLSECSLCGICVDLCPTVFRINDAGYIEVIHSDDYPEEEIDEAIKNCRENCISWKESE
ncbi:MAG TPA: ferredoxin [Desulfobacteria bacterium]|nr:ferredoxin [Desulfobacteria bacterium]